jgi:hypothetical protein
MVEGTRCNPGTCVATAASESWESPINKEYELVVSWRLSTPNPVVVLPCGSKSTTNTRLPHAAKAVAKLMAVVVLPTPPF